MSANDTATIRAILTRVNQIYSATGKLLVQGAQQMAAIDDLKAAVDAAVAEMQAAVALIQGLQNGTINADDPQVEAEVAALNAATASLTSTVSPPAPAPAPSPAPVSGNPALTPAKK